MKRVTLPPIIYPTVIEQVTHANVELPLPIEIIIISFSLHRWEEGHFTWLHYSPPSCTIPSSSASAAAESSWLSCPLSSEGQTILPSIFKYPFFNKYFIRRIKSIYGIYFELHPIASVIIFLRLWTQKWLCFMIQSFRLNQAARLFWNMYLGTFCKKVKQP